jgi:hypothetical protein
MPGSSQVNVTVIGVSSPIGMRSSPSIPTPSHRNWIFLRTKVKNLFSLFLTFLSDSLEGLILWTADTLYEMRPKVTNNIGNALPIIKQSPEVIFSQLVEQGFEKTSGEALGKTVGLDLFRLYESAADSFFDRKLYARALE